ncbi:MAG: NUDIX hydrolase [Nanoarchaeota archaeon]|nr:NUDIX hydrolase [Nanoarchaeota archaeon]
MEETKTYRIPAITVDAIIEMDNGIVLIQRGKEPFRGMWALPGGHLDYGESLEAAVAREVMEETGLTAYEVTQVRAYSEPGRDPRGHYVSMVFEVKVKGDLKAGDDAANIAIYGLDALPALAFDHAGMIRDYLAWKAKELK